jgi:dynein assembly factor 1
MAIIEEVHDEVVSIPEVHDEVASIPEKMDILTIDEKQAGGDSIPVPIKIADSKLLPSQYQDATVSDQYASDGIGNYPRMTKKSLRKLCKENKHYITPYLNDNLYMHMKGWWKIENMEEYTGLTCLWLQGNGLQKIEGLDKQEKLIVLYLHENLISRLEGLSHLKNLRVLNLEQNHIRKIEGLKELKMLETLNLAKNKLTDAESIAELAEMSEKITTIDLSNNQIKPANAQEADEIMKVLIQMPDLRVLNLMGNTIVRKIRMYRKTAIIKIKTLTYLDDRPVFPRDRACAEAWGRGGPDAEQEERVNWANKERKKIQDSVDHMLGLRNAANARRRELGLEPIGADIDLETVSLSGSEADSESSHISNKSAKSEQSATSEQSKGSSHISVIKAEGKSVSKNIFEDHEYLKNQDNVDDTSESMSESDTRNSTRNSARDSTRNSVKDFEGIDSDVQSERSFTLDSLPSCNDDVSSIASSRMNSARGNRIMIETDSEGDDDDVECPVLEEMEVKASFVEELVSEEVGYVSEVKRSALIEELD